MPEEKLIRLSQSHLNLLSSCPPKFRQVYLESLSSLPVPEQQAKMEWGSRFHLIMQQRELALPIKGLLSNNVELDNSFQALLQVAPQLQDTPDAWREAEHCRTLYLGGFLLTVIYDLLVATSEGATIVDWKTYREAPPAQKLATNWQTRLYLYVLRETTDYAPEQLQMIYWFVKSGKPKNLKFNYSHQQHQQTQQELSSLLADLESWLKEKPDSSASFPHRPTCFPTCFYHKDFYPEEDSSEGLSELLQSLDAIPEFPL